MHDVKEANAHRVWDILNFDPSKRSSAAWFTMEIFTLLYMGTGQYFVQRYVSCATVRDAQKSVWVGARVVKIICF